MDLSKIITVAGKGGLFKVVAQGRNALIVEPLGGGPRSPVHSSVKVSTLEEISMFTTEDDVPLKEVLTKLHSGQNGDADAKANDDELWKKLITVLPNADRDRIYASDVRKLFGWYELLKGAGVLDQKEEEEKKEGEEDKHEADAVAKKAAEKGAKLKAAIAGKKPVAPKPGGGKSRSTAVRKSSGRGS